jgi:hypothetical protein
MYGYLWCISLTDSICTGAGTNLTKRINRIVSTGWTLKNFLFIHNKRKHEEKNNMICIKLCYLVLLLIANATTTGNGNW